MGVYLKPNAVNEINAGTILFKEGERPNFMCWIAKGTVVEESKGIKTEIGTGEILGVADVCAGEYLGTYTVKQNAAIYAFPASTVESIHNFLYSNPVYRGMVYSSLCKQLSYYYRLYKELLIFCRSNYEYLYKHFAVLEKKGKKEYLPNEFLERHPEEELSLDADEEMLDFYSECSKIPLETQKQFFSFSDSMADFQARKISIMIQEVIRNCSDACEYIEELAYWYINDDGTGLYDQEIDFAIELKKSGHFSSMDLKNINDTKDRIMSEFQKIGQGFHFDFDIDRDKIEDSLMRVLIEPTGNTAEKTEEVEEVELDFTALDDSLKQILEYSGVSEDLKTGFTELMNQFANLTDRLDTTDEVRKLKKQITNQFYEIYEKCAFRCIQEVKIPVVIHLFLNFGFMDERLLTREQITVLLKNEPEPIEIPVSVYTPIEWLKAIYEGEKEPSRNEFDQDYAEYLREQRKTGYITQDMEKELLLNQKKKFEFEVQNMIRYNTKIVNGRLSSFVPVLYSEEFYGSPENTILSKKQLIDCMLDLERLDYSVFYHHVLYSKPEEGIEKEYIEKKVYPDIILMPTYGMVSSMWQEIATKKRDTPGRFLFPIITEENIDGMMLKCFGRYHWEFCRCVQGVMWNNIQEASLTSEYCDYVQYYRKNRNLSEERREKLKNQIQKSRNNTREVFVMDYEDWIKSEANGAMKLNKVAREFMATYCPLEKSYREAMEKNTALKDAMARFNREKAKTIKDYELHLHNLEKNNILIPPEMEETYKYYTEQ